ncbi:MAG: hypothetical protein NUV64_01585 [Parcubacteria group bacterium]|nr:hypothetical protein [Parcubacteria group bacterium]MCR4342735.1 hypothetical protein [Patescibacteria group bacterium]
MSNNQYNSKLMDKYKDLPGDVREAIFSVDSTEIIQDISKKNNLTIDKMSELADEIGLLMIGVTEPKDFMPNISRRLGVDKKTAHDITAEVNDRIFSKIRESLKRIHNIKDEEDSEKDTAESLKQETVREPEPAKTLSKEDILKEIESPESIPMPQVFSDAKVNESTSNAQTLKQETVSVEGEGKEIPIPSMPSTLPVVMEEKEESIVVAKEDLPKEYVKSGGVPFPPKPQISRRPPEVSEHDGDKPLGPGGDKYPEGDPYREPVK